jgi:uncharacterized membrane protein
VAENGEPSGGAVERPGNGGADNELERLAARLLQDISEGTDGADGNGQGPVMFSEKYRGPFTHPYILKELNEVVQNGAERAFRLTEKEQEFRHESVTKLLTAEIDDAKKTAFDRRLVIILIFVFLLLCLAGAFAAVMTGHNTGAGLVAGAGAVLSGGAYLVNRSRNKKASGKDDD